jgi:hypothetical protein
MGRLLLNLSEFVPAKKVWHTWLPAEMPFLTFLFHTVFLNFIEFIQRHRKVNQHRSAITSAILIKSYGLLIF